MPLFVPTDNLVLTYSQRLVSGTTRFYADAPVNPGGCRCVSDSTDGGVEEIERYAALRSKRGDRRVSETAAYANLLIGNLGEARKQLTLAQAPDVSTHWESAIIERARLIGGLLDVSGLDGAIEQLEVWASENHARFKLADQ